MFIDEFGGKNFKHQGLTHLRELVSSVGRGYVPFETTNITAGLWTISTNYILPSRPRHGSVIPM